MTRPDLYDDSPAATAYRRAELARAVRTSRTDERERVTPDEAAAALIEDFEFLLAGGTPVIVAAHRVGYGGREAALSRRLYRWNRADLATHLDQAIRRAYPTRKATTRERYGAA